MFGSRGERGGAWARATGAVRAAVPVARLGVRRLRGEKSPFQMTFSLTNRCNFRCDYCEIPLQKRDEMTTDEWLRAIDELRAGGMGRASLIGGEPLLKKDAGTVIRHLKSHGVHTAMNTNGWFVKDRLDEVRELDLVCITLDGPREVHDAQRHPGSYDRVIEALEVLLRHGVPVVTMGVITPRGAGSLDHVLEVARDMGFRAYFQLEHDKTVDVDAPIAPELSDARIAEIAQRLIDRKDEGWPVGNSRTVLRMLQRDGRRIGGTCEDCFAGRYYGYMLSDGTVAPCLLTQWQQERGNGRTLGFLRAFHEMNPPQGPGCSCMPTHEVNRILAYDASVLFGALDLSLKLRGGAPRRPTVRRLPVVGA